MTPPPPTLPQLIPDLQVAIGPVILISGIGLLLLTMTNRLGRCVDRARVLANERRAGTAVGRRTDEQIDILMHRARLIRRAITLAAFSALLAAILVIGLFASALLRIESGWAIAPLFALCMVSLIGALISFIQDVNLSLVALKLDVSE